MSTLVIDTIQGKTTAGSVNVRGEGSNNTNLQQGLVKVHCNLNGTGTIAFRDSFNMSSPTDNGTGDYTFAFTTNMGNANYSVMPSSASGYTGISACNRNVKVNSGSTAPSTSVVRTQYGNNWYSASQLEDCPQQYMAICGDLA